MVEEKQLEDTKALYWWGENFSVALEGTKAETGERPKLTLEFLAPSLDITLDLERKPLAQFGIEEVAFEVEIDNQSTVESNFHILHFIADDLTGSELNKFPGSFHQSNMMDIRLLVEFSKDPISLYQLNALLTVHKSF